ncbi:Atxe2 family lasso peptide isopeptidase [Sphingomonas sp. IW22]|uniref:Atxe2 family lasso peptide isopeptidase n=1 Tax=Sphingomonas sp. IW22 TaxID=3242489 RepID=UPI003521D5D9
MKGSNGRPSNIGACFTASSPPNINPQTRPISPFDHAAKSAKSSDDGHYNASDIADFRISADGQSLILSSRQSLNQAYLAIATEGRTGYLFDDRYFPIASNAPFVPAPAPKSFTTIDLQTGASRPATPGEEQSFRGSGEAEPAGTQSVTSNPLGRRAWTYIDPDGPIPYAVHLAVEGLDQRKLTCAAETCSDIAVGAWWSKDGQRVRFLRREGWARGTTAIYEWVPGKDKPRKLYETTDVLFDCKPIGDDLLCLAEGSVVPRRIVRVDLSKGRQQAVFEPNPEFAGLAKGEVKRLQWTTSFGVEMFGDLVLPVGFRSGTRYPMIVVQYGSRGFLRGGTGDEYPIQAFANDGFAVLSIERPRSPAVAPGAKSYADLDKADLTDFIDKRNVLSGIEVGVRKVIDSGVADGRRIGITGLSDGATTVQFAGVNSTMFAAASMSNCCAEPTQLALLGPAAARQYEYVGWPALTSASDSFWSSISWVKNASKIRFPVLLQMADSEYRSALAAFTALREVDAPIELRIYPDETHIKWQPTHRLAIYRRNLDWFAFWLKDERPQGAAGEIEARQWAKLAAPGGQVGASRLRPD